MIDHVSVFLSHTCVPGLATQSDSELSSVAALRTPCNVLCRMGRKQVESESEDDDSLSSEFDDDEDVDAGPDHQYNHDEEEDEDDNEASGGSGDDDDDDGEGKYPKSVRPEKTGGKKKSGGFQAMGMI